MQTDALFSKTLVFDGIDEMDVEKVTAVFGTIDIVAKGRTPGATCPDCGSFLRARARLPPAQTAGSAAR